MDAWATEVNIPANLLTLRIRRGWTPERTLTTSPRRDRADLIDMTDFIALYEGGQSLSELAPRFGYKRGKTLGDAVKRRGYTKLRTQGEANRLRITGEATLQEKKTECHGRGYANSTLKQADFMADHIGPINEQDPLELVPF